MMTNVFILGSKGIPAKYGGFETFVHKLTEKREAEEIRYHIYCLSEKEGQYIYNDAVCYNMKIANVGSARAVLYDLSSLRHCMAYIKKNKLGNSIIYILTCRIGPFLSFYKPILKKMGVKVYINPDGHEWKRSKWNTLVKAYWKFSERLMVKHADLLICDSIGIESYIRQEYWKYRPKTTYISYGAEVNKSNLDDTSTKLTEWYEKNGITKSKYYLIVGRFVPENNYETMIKEFMKSDTEKDLVIITNVEKNKFYQELLKISAFDMDKRVKFVGTVYDEELLKKIRENAFAYIHGHEVGGTNPSLLEALASTKLNILFDVEFNREVGSGGALYFNKLPNSLANLINQIEQYSEKRISHYEKEAKRRIYEKYSWDKIVKQYENLFLCSENKQVNRR